jgi:hypothetical protein
MLTRVFKSCWTTPTLLKIMVNVAYVGKGGDSYRFWTTENPGSDRNTTLSLDVLPPSTRLLELPHTWRISRASLRDVVINVECQIPWDPTGKVYIPAKWSFRYSTTMFTERTGTWYITEDDENDPTKLERLPLDVGCAVVALNDKHIHSACTYIRRDTQSREELARELGPDGGDLVYQLFTAMAAASHDESDSEVDVL